MKTKQINTKQISKKSNSTKVLAAGVLGAVSLMNINPAFSRGYADAPVFYEYAKVVESTPIYETRYSNTPRQSCWLEEEVRYTPSRSHGHGLSTGAVLGGIIGAAVGNELGHEKRNKQVGAVAGALLGASIGRDVSAKGHRGYRTQTRHQVEKCDTVYDRTKEQVITGYDVVYRYKGDTYHMQTPYRPGRRVKLKVQFEPVI